jgi:hypothetical protein
MTTTFTPSHPTIPVVVDRGRSAERRPLPLVGLAAGALAAGANVLVVGSARGLGVSVELRAGAHGAQPIPMAGFVTMTLAGALV